MKRRSFAATMLPLLVATATAAAQARIDFTSLDRVVAAELAETKTPGAALAIVSGDRIVYSKGYGVANVETGAPVTADMLFRIASTTKMYTTSLVTLLAEEGKLQLDAPIGQVLSGLPPQLSKLTAHQLMTHTAGLRDIAKAWGSHDASALAATVSTLTDSDFFTEPGRVFSYANPGFALAGYLAEKVGGAPYAEQVERRLFRPLGMNRTTFQPTVAMTYPLAQGHRVMPDGKAQVVRPFADNAGYWPAGFIFSSVTDLARFAIMFVNGGAIDGNKVLPTSVVTKLATGYAPTHSAFEGASYGYGLLIREFRGMHVVEHGGSIDGFGSIFRMVPDQQFAVIILTNKSGQTLDKSAERAMELVLPLQGRSNSKASAPFAATDLTELPGRYMQPGFIVDILARDGKLIFRQGTEEHVMIKVADGRFMIDDDPAATRPLELVAVRGPHGRIEYIHIGLRALAKQP